MDWISYYALFWLVTNTASHVYMNGKPLRYPYWNLRTYLIGLILAVPIYGRLFGMW